MNFDQNQTNLKIFSLKRRLNSKSGIILFIILWTLVILSALAISLGRSTNIEMAIAKNTVSRLKSKYLALAGITLAQNQILLDTQDGGSNSQDTLYLCGISSAQGSAEAIFKEVELGDGQFEVAYQMPESEDKYYGMLDEDRKINLNALNKSNIRVFISLLTLKGYELDLAQRIAYSVLDWKDVDNVLTQSYSAEDQYYMNLAENYHCKNAPFDVIQELLYIREVTKEIYLDIKDYVTVFPKEGNLQINFDTASEVVLGAVARSASGSQTNTSKEDADALVEKIIEHRQGDDGEPFTSDDQTFNPADAALNAKEDIIYQVIDEYRTFKSDYFRLTVNATDLVRNSTSSIEGVVERESLDLLYWYRN